MTRSGDLLGACTPKGTATYPANHAWRAAYPANHVGLAPSLPGSSLPGTCHRQRPTRQQPTRQRAYPANQQSTQHRITRPADLPRHTSPTPTWQMHPSRLGATRRTYPANHDACAPGGPTRQITRPTRQVRISEAGSWDRHARPV